MTGVQTCALPISRLMAHANYESWCPLLRPPDDAGSVKFPGSAAPEHKGDKGA